MLDGMPTTGVGSAEARDHTMTKAKRTLVLVRHAKSAWPLGVADADRPLAGRGNREAPLVGKWLHEHLTDVDLVLCSTAVRARETWSLAADALDQRPKVRHEDQLYAASAAELLAVARTLPKQAHTVIMIGHNPGLEDFVQLLSGTAVELKTSAIAVLTTARTWADLEPDAASLERTATAR